MQTQKLITATSLESFTEQVNSELYKGYKFVTDSIDVTIETNPLTGSVIAERYIGLVEKE